MLRLLELNAVAHQIALSVTQGETRIGRLIEALRKLERGATTKAAGGSYAFYGEEGSDDCGGANSLGDQLAALGAGDDARRADAPVRVRVPPAPSFPGATGR